MRMITLALMLTLLPIARTGAAVDLTGNWIIDGDVQGNTVSLACVVKQADEKIAGKCQINGTDTADIDGTSADSGFKFAFTVQGYTLTYTGKVEGEIMSGDIEVAGVTGKFSGKRS